MSDDVWLRLTLADAWELARYSFEARLPSIALDADLFNRTVTAARVALARKPGEVWSGLERRPLDGIRVVYESPIEPSGERERRVVVVGED